MLTTFVLPACSSVVYRLRTQFVAVPNLLAVLALATVLRAETAANAVRLIQSGAVQLECEEKSGGLVSTFASTSIQFSQWLHFHRSLRRPFPLPKLRVMSNTIVRGTVHVIEDTKSFGQKGFRKRLVVLEQQNGRFANYVPLEFTNDACDAVDELKLGDEVDVTYRLSGRKWQKDPTSEVKYFLSAEAMGFNKVGAGKAGPNDDDLNDVFSQAAADDEGDAPF